MIKSHFFTNINKHKLEFRITQNLLCLFVFRFALFCVLPCIMGFTMAFFILLVETYAQSVSTHLNIAPAKIELEVRRGDTLEDFVRIGNKSDVSMPLEARVLNFTAEDYTGAIQFISKEALRAETEEGIDDTSFNTAKWIEIKNPNFILDAGGSEDIDFTVKVPENAEPGGKYAVILFEPKIPASALEEGVSLIIPEVGMLLIFTVDVEGVERAEEPFAISSFQLPEEERMRTLETMAGAARDLIVPGARAGEILQIIEKSSFSFTLGIRNKDIVHFRPEGKITMYNFWGKKTDEIEVRQQTILPGKTRELRVKFDPGEKEDSGILPRFIARNLYLGSYSAIVQLKIPDGFSDQEVFTFWIFPWKPLVALSAFLIALFIVRKRVGGAIKILAIGAPRRILRRNKESKTKNEKPQI